MLDVGCASPKLHPVEKLNRCLDILTVKSRLDRPNRASWKAMKTQADGILARDRSQEDEEPACMGGRGATPPEFCGGPTGYRLMLKRQSEGKAMLAPAIVETGIPSHILIGWSAA